MSISEVPQRCNSANECPIYDRKADIALIGLAVMGQNLILNMDSKGFVVCAYNRTVDKVNPPGYSQLQ